MYKRLPLDVFFIYVEVRLLQMLRSYGYTDYDIEKVLEDFELWGANALSGHSDLLVRQSYRDIKFEIQENYDDILKEYGVENE